MASTITLYGWDLDVWSRVIKWAGSDLTAWDALDKSRHPDFLSLRKKWLRAGGPWDGPKSNLALTNG